MVQQELALLNPQSLDLQKAWHCSRVRWCPCGEFVTSLPFLRNLNWKTKEISLIAISILKKEIFKDSQRFPIVRIRACIFRNFSFICARALDQTTYLDTITWSWRCRSNHFGHDRHHRIRSHTRFTLTSFLSFPNKNLQNRSCNTTRSSVMLKRDFQLLCILVIRRSFQNRTHPLINQGRGTFLDIVHDARAFGVKHDDAAHTTVTEMVCFNRHAV